MKHLELPPLSFVFGEETFLVEKYLETLKKNTEEVIQISGPNLMSEWAIQGQSLSLFSAEKVIVLTSPWFLEKAPTEPENKAILAQLEAARTSPDPTVIWCPSKVDLRKKWASWLKKNVPTTEFVAFKDWEQQKVMGWIQDWGKSLGKKISTESAVILEQMGGTNLRYLASEIEKIAVFCGEKQEITPQDILAVSAGASGRIFMLTEALKSKDLPTALQALSRLKEDNEDPIKLMGLVVATLRFYLQILDGYRRKRSLPDMAQELGKNPYFLKQVAPVVQKKYTLESLQKAYCKFSELDLAIKSGRMSAQKALEIGVIKALAPGDGLS
jgi:DNA polymerase-3 subunit delta